MLVAVIILAVAFDYINGFHDTANAIATSVATRALAPAAAIAMATAFNFIGAFAGTAVAKTIGAGLVDEQTTTQAVVAAALIGAIAWNLFTWRLGLPSSSSHALIGGLLGATIAAVGTGAVKWDGVVNKVLIPLVTSPVIGFTGAFVLMIILLWLFRRSPRKPLQSGFRRLQVFSAGYMAFAHGSNDAQKTMGIITLALVAHGNISPNHFYVPDWVVVTSATAIALGTWIGGWRIIRTMGSRIINMDPAQGFSAQGAGASVILAASHAGYPLSTTHVISGSVMGAGAAKRISAVRWGVAGNIAVAWVLTLPAAALIGGVVYGVTEIFGASSALGPIVVSGAILVGSAVLFLRRAAGQGGLEATA
jgi:PiT family inorganic phosphate transporter